jgi:hypothetical protein
MIGAVRNPPLIDPANPFIRAMADYDIRHHEGSSYKARCPAHDDSTPSLCISAGDNGGIVIHCHAGCSAESVVRAVGCKLADLMPPKPRDPKPKIVATYDYRDENGELLYQRVRYQPKDFRNRRPNGDGGWAWDLKGVRKVLYRLPELTAARAAGSSAIRFIVESEKTADRMAAAGLLVCSCGGAKNWRKEFAEGFAGESIVFLHDNDKPGLDCANEAAASLKAAGVGSIKAILLGDLGAGGDPFDWLEAGLKHIQQPALPRLEHGGQA